MVGIHIQANSRDGAGTLMQQEVVVDQTEFTGKSKIRKMNRGKCPAAHYRQNTIVQKVA